MSSWVVRPEPNQQVDGVRMPMALDVTGWDRTSRHRGVCERLAEYEL
jgi:hypothetical protein